METSQRRINLILNALMKTEGVAAQDEHCSRVSSINRKALNLHETSAEDIDGFIKCYGNHARPFQEWAIGQRYITKRRTIPDADIINYTHLTGYDAENLFGDMVYLKETAGHDRRLVPGMLTGSIADALIVGSGILEGYAVALVSINNFRALAPVYAGDTIQVEMEVTKVKPSKSKKDRGIVTTYQKVKNQDGKVVVEYEVSRMIRRSS
uniref:MaoC-like domain-containing protein n=1 Tax=Aplanochytrium stocchinoi TaxID=215587 RepID=A0A7S3PFL7_9STRA|mmetsp:Transcript_15049/g.18614  ORF Transcript_15049/g.18614 Transcript_15049/m.18614 type:complete len:209 (-) Transcript_15049:388-1014(-)|eukprot:CAMPEP_0204890216 /NCGR_PEP_ID=MMETSP1349-20130617/24632_1 /ASSEMBLY_ACC=CAM_ASM_000710 /TAXON_ID=215587 /ORGANISM="Aplanochytrium stocchinoi, Strain GSBS06" /LENGTH=208 /DNA_ID=CAMNT_0052054821 /DNA_START=30 /DNA_END=656 /DNA_ORIENTATION=+